MELHQHIRHHIQKHHKKYLFVSGAASGRGLFKIMIFSSLFLGISALGGKSDVYAEKVEAYQAIASFYQIDDIAHQEFEKTIKEGNPFDEGTIKEFNILDAEFHDTTDINQQFKAAKKIVDFITKQGKNNLQSEPTDRDRERDQRFADLLAVFNRIK